MFKQQALNQVLNLRQKIALQNAKKIHALRKQAAVEGSVDHVGSTSGDSLIHHTTADGQHHDHVNMQQLLIRRNAICILRGTYTYIPQG